MKRYRTIVTYKEYFERFLEQQTPKVQTKILQISGILLFRFRETGRSFKRISEKKRKKRKRRQSGK